MKKKVNGQKTESKQKGNRKKTEKRKERERGQIWR